MQTRKRVRLPGVMLPIALGLSVAACAADEFVAADAPGAADAMASADPVDGSRDDSAPLPADGGATPSLDTSCGGQNIAVELVRKPSDLMLVVDRSGSMSDPVDLLNPFGDSKWKVMRTTLAQVLQAFSGQIRFGLSLYPSDDTCGAGAIEVPLASGQETTIDTRLAAVVPKGGTPTHTTLQSAQQHLATVPAAEGGRYLLLTSDGFPNCGGDDPDVKTTQETLAAVQALAAAKTKVFVVGFGSFFLSDPTYLDQLAKAGGVPNPSGPNAFYAASDQATLKKALFGIAATIVPPPCTYRLASAPPDPEKVTVTFDGQPVPRDPAGGDGWDYDVGGGAIVFSGPACERLQQGKVTAVAFVFGCKGPVIN